MKTIDIFISFIVLTLIFFFSGIQFSWTSVMHFALLAVIVAVFGVGFRFFQAAPHISIDDFMDMLGIEKENHRSLFLNGFFIYFCVIGLIFGGIFWYLGITAK